MGTVSAIVSAYYCSAFLQQRLDNLHEQDCEIVIIAQEGSKEAEIAKNELLVLTPDIPTIYKAWNLGIKASTGDYLTSANSDDIFYPGALRKMADVLDNDKRFAIIYSDVDMTDTIGGEKKTTYKNSRGDFDELMHRCFVGPFPMWRKSLHEKYGMFNEEFHVAGDYEFWLRIASNGERFYYMPESLGLYVDRPDSAEHKERVRTLWETARAKRPYRSKQNGRN